MPKKRKKVTKYSVLQEVRYKDGTFAGGLVKNSIHKSDKIFLKIKDNVFELRDDEIDAIIWVLSLARWCDYQYLKQKKVKLKWIEKDKL